MCLCIGHRGACGYARDNSLESIRRALEFEVDIVEVDVRPDKNGVLVLSHDEKRDGMMISEHCNTELGLPTLEEALDIIGHKAGIYVDVKLPTNIKSLKSIIHNSRRPYALYFGCVVDDIVMELKLYNSVVHVGIIENRIKIKVDQTKNAISFVALPFKSVTAQRVTLFNMTSTQVFVYKVNEKKDIEKCKEMLVDGIISDYPDRIKKS